MVPILRYRHRLCIEAAVELVECLSFIHSIESSLDSRNAQRRLSGRIPHTSTLRVPLYPLSSTSLLFLSRRQVCHVRPVADEARVVAVPRAEAARSRQVRLVVDVKVPLAMPCACMRAVVERFEVDDNFASSQIVSSLHLVGSSRLSLIVRRHLVFPYSHRVAISSSHHLIVSSWSLPAASPHCFIIPHHCPMAPSSHHRIALIAPPFLAVDLRGFTPDVFFVVQSRLCISDWLFINSWHCSLFSSLLAHPDVYYAKRQAGMFLVGWRCSPIIVWRRRLLVCRPRKSARTHAEWPVLLGSIRRVTQSILLSVMRVG